MRRHSRAALPLAARLTASLPAHLRTLNTIAVAAFTIGCADDAAVAPAVVESPPSASLGFPPWTEMASAAGSGLEAVWGASPDEVFAVGLSGVIQRFDGTSWSIQATGTTSSLRDVWGSSEDDVWAVGGLGALLHYDGASWDLVARLENDAGTRYQLFGIWGSSASDIWAVGNSGTAHHYDGHDWRYVSLPTNEVVRGVWGIGAGDVFAVGDAGLILHFDGTSWTSMVSPTDTRMNAVHGRSASDVFAAGSFGAILHFDGERWVEDPQSRVITRAHIRDLWSDAAGNIFAVAWGGTILHHDGRRWNQMTSGTTRDLEGVWSSGTGRMVAVGESGIVMQGGRGLGFSHGPPGTDPAPVWPLSGVAVNDADSVHAPYGPRALPAGYDFHAGVDLPAPRGTPVLAVRRGEVVGTTVWNGSSSAGNNVIVRHESGEATAYLHLDRIDVQVGEWLEGGDQLGTVGSTGATYPHLHLGYFRTLNTNSIDERQSFNPLEVLPHGQAGQVGATFSGDSVTLSVPLQRMTIRSIEISGGDESRTVDYYSIVRLGSSARDNQLQNGVHLNASRASNGRFDLTLRAESFRLERVIVRDYEGRTVLDRRVSH